ncbi:hypothetical protein K7432_008521 [Basidiobolus ranarum]|uniref:TauD/TfdA-like domain-containing protein n=1 Tax=Basidiobolus ranarum TaxID=34480 RepID=A0ABR2VYF4_9FUNG
MSFYQVLPSPYVSHQEYCQEQRKLLIASDSDWPYSIHLLANPYPIFCPAHRMQEMKNLQSAIHEGLHLIIDSWWSEPEFYNAIPVPAKLENVLKRLAIHRPYEVGSYRPDFLVPEDDNAPIQVCEINCRFMFNGFLMAQYVQKSIEPWIDGQIFGAVEGSANDNIPSQFLQLFDPAKPLVLIKGREQGYSIHLFQRWFKNSRFADPSELAIVPDPTSATGYQLVDRVGVIEQCALELHQAELEALDDDLLFELGMRCFNDLRTVTLAHDKRMLALLQSDKLRLLGLSDSHHQVLRDGIAPTFLPTDEQFHIAATENHFDPNDWLLKACRLGKGEGIVFGSDASKEEWQALAKSQLELHIPDNFRNLGSFETPVYILQRRIKQKIFRLLISNEGSKDPKTCHWSVVGTFPCINDTFLGAVPWRSSSGDIIAVSRNGTWFPGVTPNGGYSQVEPKYSKKKSWEVPKSAKLTTAGVLPSLSEISEVQTALKKHGFALIKLTEPDPESSYVLSVAEAIGVPIEHSSTHGPLWDIKPIAGGLARSQTDKEFEWHTDCSYVPEPPRYFGLHVLHSDKMGGGTLQLLRVSTLLESLSASVLATLSRNDAFRIMVPQEFYSGTSNIIASLISSDIDEGYLMRFRRDIIEPLDSEAREALQQLELALIRAEEDFVHSLTSEVMDDSTVLIVDNCKWLHSRTGVKDQNRWLRRVRFESKPNQS